MSVGVVSLTCYQSEDVSWLFTLTDINVTDVSTWVFEWKIKQTAASLDPPLLFGTCTFPSAPPTLDYLLEEGIDLAPGDYVLSIRRTGASTRWQTHEGALHVLDTGSVD